MHWYWYVILIVLVCFFAFAMIFSLRKAQNAEYGGRKNKIH